MGCTFCAIEQGESPAEIIYADDHAFAFMDLLPMTAGHCLVVPRRHVGTIVDLDDDAAAHVMQAARRVAALVIAALQPAGLNLLNNNGAAADQSQPHFHFHLIPRYGDDRLLHPWERRFGDWPDIQATAARIRNATNSGADLRDR